MTSNSNNMYSDHQVQPFLARLSMMGSEDVATVARSRITVRSIIGKLCFRRRGLVLVAGLERTGLPTWPTCL